MTPAEEKAFWQACEESKLNDPAPLLMFADRLTERGRKKDLRLAYTLRWMARFRKRPRNNTSYERPWGWDWHGSSYTSLEYFRRWPDYLPAELTSVNCSAFRRLSKRAMTFAAAVRLLVPCVVAMARRYGPEGYVP